MVSKIFRFLWWIVAGLLMFSSVIFIMGLSNILTISNGEQVISVKYVDGYVKGAYKKKSGVKSTTFYEESYAKFEDKDGNIYEFHKFDTWQKYGSANGEQEPLFSFQIPSIFSKDKEYTYALILNEESFEIANYYGVDICILAFSFIIISILALRFCSKMEDYFLQKQKELKNKELEEYNKNNSFEALSNLKEFNIDEFNDKQ